ncbi:MAG TPA: hypothetical protein DCS93_10875 [Microscillaceae bacterium]|nr:hypothetical protein [Microscillaceae bacterium]
MKIKLLIILLLLAGLFSQTQAQFNEKDLIGYWQVNIPKIIKSAANLGQKMSLQEEMGMVSMMGAIREFRADGTYINSESVLPGKGKKDQGKWKLVGKEIILSFEGRKDQIITLIALDRSQFTMEPKNEEGGRFEFITLNPILEALRKKNDAKTSTAKITGDWTLTALEKDGQITCLGHTYSFAADGKFKATTLMKHEEKGIWKLENNNTLGIGSQAYLSPCKIVYFTPQQMVLEDQEGIKMLLNRVQ